MSEAAVLPRHEFADEGAPPSGHSSRDELVLAPRLRAGDRVRLSNGPVYELVRKTRLVKTFRRLDCGSEIELGNVELVTKFASGELRLVAPAWVTGPRAKKWAVPFEARPEIVKRLAFMRRAYVEAFAENRRQNYPRKVGVVLEAVHAERMRDPANAAAGEQKPSMAAVYEWVGACGGSDADPGSIKLLTFAEDERGTRGVQLHHSVSPLVKDALRELWFTPQRHRASKVWDRVVTTCGDGNIPASRVPALRTIRRLIRQLPPFVVARERLGRRAADHMFKSVGQMQEATLPGELYEVDAHKLDLFAVDDRPGWPLGRVWVTLVIDRCTRMLVGFHVHVEPPSSLTIAAALRNAFAPKTYMLERWPDIGRSWNAWGLPNLVIMDNALENKARFLTEALSELGVRWLFAEPRTPEDKPYAERVIGTLARSFSPAVPGWTGASPRERGDYDTAGMACMTLIDIDELLHRWVVNYNVTFHQTIRAIPEQRWLELSDGEAAPFEDIMMLDALLGDFAERTLTRKGVYLLGLRYGDRGSYRPLESLLARRGHEGRLRIRVRFDRTDLSFIWVQDPDTREYFKVPSLDPDYTDRLSLARHRVIRAHAVEKARGYVSIADLCRARDNLQRRIDELAGGAVGTMTERKFAAIWTGLGAKGSWNDLFRLTENEYGPTKKNARSIVDLLDEDEAEFLDQDNVQPQAARQKRAPEAAAAEARVGDEVAPARHGLRAEAEELGVDVEGVELPDEPAPDEPEPEVEPDARTPAHDDLAAEMAALGIELE